MKQGVIYPREKKKKKQNKKNNFALSLYCVEMKKNNKRNLFY
jgi:hypothetical protein